MVPSASNSGCVSWGATILSTTVQDTDGDGLLDVWENNKGYTDAASGSGWRCREPARTSRTSLSKSTT